MSATVTTLATATGTVNGYHSQNSSFAYDSVSGLLFGIYLQADGDVAAAAWNSDGTLAQAVTVLHTTLDPGDSHGSPVLHIRSDRKIVALYCEHNGTAMYQRISSAAANITAWAAETNLDATLGGANYTYPQVGETDDALYLFYRRTAGAASQQWAYSKSTNDGDTWAAETVFALETGAWGYLSAHRTSAARIDFLWTDGAAFGGVDPAPSIYHFYLDTTDDTFYTTNGAEITASLPLDSVSMTRIWLSDGGTGAVPFGTVALGSDGYPRIAFTEFRTVSPDPELARYHWGRWTGTAWSTAVVASSGSGSQTATCCLDPDNPAAVWYSKDVGSTAQIFTAITGDNGASFAHAQVTSDAPEHALLNPIANAGSSQTVVWQSLSGGWTRDDTVSAAFSGGVWYAVPGVWIDWASDGVFGSASDDDPRLARIFPQGRSVNDDITADTHRFDWSYGGSADHVSGTNPGRCTIVVQNDDGKYTPENTASALYGYLTPGKRVWIGLNADGTITGTGQTVYGVFSGYIREIVPLVEDGATAFAEILCDDPTGLWVQRPVKVAADTDYTYGTLRQAVLADIGEGHTDLDNEPDTLPLAAADSDNALSVLGEIDKATGSRSWWNPGDSKEAFGAYTTRDRHHKLGDAVDAAINSDDVQAISGYRVTLDNLVNYQQADVAPARFPAGIDTIWTYAEASFPVSSKRTIWTQFDDFVKDATLDYTSTGGAVTSVLTNFGTTAKIELWSASSSVIANLSIEGRMVQRDAAEAVTAEDAASQAAYGKRAGTTINSTYAGTTALAQGVADYAVWKFAQPRKRPGITQIHETSASLSRDMYDTIAYTLDRLNVSGRRFEIVGISGAYEAGPLLIVSWELQETPNQSALDLFTFGESAFDGADLLGY